MATPVKASERLIVALDLDDISAAKKMVQDLEGMVSFFKVGLGLQLAKGAQDFTNQLIQEGKKVFLDYKYYDIAETLQRAVSRACETGAAFLTIHGPSSLMRAAVGARGASATKLFTVTVLTSMDIEDVQEMGYTAHAVEEVVLHRAQKALEAGCDGVIASALEARKIKEMSKGKLVLVTPGIRPLGSSPDDQQRRATPGQAVQEGADYLVVGRPILAPRGKTPQRAVEQILEEMQDAFDSVPEPLREDHILAQERR